MDWDQDGKLDILSGCYWTDEAEAGQIQILKGKGGLDFGASVSLKNANGDPLENVEITDANEDQQTLAICTQQHAVDYDGDGDLDLVVGCFLSNFYLYENKADEENGEQSLSVSPIELPIKSPSYHSGPHLTDWDNDGDLDLLSGSGDGGVLYSENSGTRESPKWEKFKQLVEYSSLHQQTTSNNEEIQMSPSTRVWTHDFNGDGLLDLLVGDSATIVNPVEGLSEEECKRLKSENDKAIAQLSKKQSPIYEEFEKLAERGEETSPELEAKMEELSQQFSEVFNARTKFENTRRTGFVWLLIRKPATN